VGVAYQIFKSPVRKHERVRNMKNSLRARVFISCGQQKGTDEVNIAHKIAEKLENMGFEPYIAVEERTLKGVKENILQRLSESEYFIFVDFKRERLHKPKNGSFEDTGKHRGSLFSHQELAIAAFLGIEVLAFREKDVKEQDGMLGFIQANCIEFSDRHMLPDFVAEKVREQEWNPNQRNELVLERDTADSECVSHAKVSFARREWKQARYYYIRVKNRHQEKTARDCVAYLVSAKNLSTGETNPYDELVELKWKGVVTDRVAIPPNRFRFLDAFRIFYDKQHVVQAGINPVTIDWEGYYELYKLEGPGNFELSYVVFSENFSPVKATFRLHIGNRLDDIEFYKRE